MILYYMLFISIISTIAIILVIHLRIATRDWWSRIVIDLNRDLHLELIRTRLSHPTLGAADLQVNIIRRRTQQVTFNLKMTMKETNDSITRRNP